MIQARGRWIRNHETGYWETIEPCVYCGEKVVLGMTNTHFQQYMSGVDVQDIKPEIDLDMQAMLIHGSCPACFISDDEEE